MADSDDEHDKGRGRDKFRRERSDYGEKSRSRGDKRGWRDDYEFSRRRGREDDDRERRRYSSGSDYRGGPPGRDWSPPPPPKRMRREPWESFPEFPGGMVGPYGLRPPWLPPGMPPHHHQMPRPGGLSDPPGPPGSKRPPMLTFKHFLSQQDDNIDEAQAIHSYNDYKVDFKRRQISEFFDNHKEGDWLVTRYHPRHLKQQAEQARANLTARVTAFSHLLRSGQLDSATLTQTNHKNIVRTMDSAVILMEGGTSNDLLSLNQPSGEGGEANPGDQGAAAAALNNSSDGEGDGDKPAFMTAEPSEEQRALAEQARSYGQRLQGEDSDKDGAEETKTGDGTTEAGLSGAAQTEALPETGQTEGSSSSSSSATADGGGGKPRPLHMTRSVYIRHIPASVPAEDIVEVCRTIPGYLRVAFADPNPERDYERRGWVTYSNDTDIREVTARLSTNKIKDCQLNCMVNRDLTRRVKHIGGVAGARNAVLSDLNLAVKLTRALDERHKLWEHADTEEETQKNPVLMFPKSLLEEEEEEPVSMVMGTEEEEGVVSDPGTEMMSSSSEKLQLLDRLVWYLRIVHSLDFYNGNIFPSEDCMPHRCGIITAREPAPKQLTLEEVLEHCKVVSGRIQTLLDARQELTDDEMDKFGKKDAEAEVERFIEVNTQKLTDNKYLCPLSGKKFKGPDFVRKHIFNKHVEQVQIVQQEVEFFNNYLRDPERPCPPEGPPMPPLPPLPPGLQQDSPKPGGPRSWPQSPQMAGMFDQGNFPPGMGPFPPGMSRGPFRPPHSGGRRGRGRRVVHYHDLDAPADMY